MCAAVSRTFCTVILALLVGVLGGLLPTPGRSANSSPTSDARQATPPAAATRALVDEIRSNMVEVKSGTFEMGDRAGSSDSFAKPVRTVSVAAFWISRYEVTFDQYDAYARAVGKPLPPDEGWGRGKRPVVNISWEDAKAFATWVSAISGFVYRLPSEAEWEYAARAGTRTDYYWGERYGEDGTHTEPPLMNDWVWDGGTAPVGSFPANGWGLHDMLGNASEWTEDCWNTSYERAPTDGSAWTAGDCRNRAYRGGSWCDAPACQKVWIRAWGEVSGRSGGIGFRLARSH